jgi:hypothetical protein
MLVDDPAVVFVITGKGRSTYPNCQGTFYFLEQYLDTRCGCRIHVCLEFSCLATHYVDTHGTEPCRLRAAVSEN